MGSASKCVSLVCSPALMVSLGEHEHGTCPATPSLLKAPRRFSAHLVRLTMSLCSVVVTNQGCSPDRAAPPVPGLFPILSLQMFLFSQPCSSAVRMCPYKGGL